MAQAPEEAENPAGEDEGPLTISPEKVCFIIIKAREFDAKDAVTEPDPASNPSDDRDTAVLEDHRDDPVVEELTGVINTLSQDPLLGDFLEEGLSMLGYSCEEFEIERL